MGRPARSASESDWHHVMNRGARRLPIFGDDDDRRCFLRLVGEPIDRGDAHVHAYALMGNHFHLLIEAPVPGLVATMKHVGEHYTRRFNAKYGLDGPLFRGRYRSKPLLTERHRLQVLRYIHRNPVEDGFGGLGYRWSSHNAYAALASGPRWLSVGTLLGELGSRQAYARFVDDEGDGQTVGSFDERRGWVRTGTVEAVDWALGIGSAPELDLVRRGAVRADRRLAAVMLAAEQTSRSSTELASHYGYRSGSGVRMAVSRARSRLESDPTFASLVAEARDRLSGLGARPDEAA